MKQVSMPIYNIEEFIRFCEMANLNIMDKIIDGTSQQAYATFMVNGKHDSSLKDAEDSYMINGGNIVSIYGVYSNSPNGIKNLLLAKKFHEENKNAVLLNINDLTTTP